MPADPRPAAAPLRILLADAAPMQRSGLRSVLSPRPTDAGDPAHTPGSGGPTGAPRTADSTAATMRTPGTGDSAGETARRPGTDTPTRTPGSGDLTGATARTPGTGDPTRVTEAAGVAISHPGPAAPAGGAGSPAGPTGGDESADHAEIVIAGEAGDGVEAIDLARRLLPDVLITDLTLPRMDGLAVTRAIVTAGLPVRVLILTDDDGDEQVLAAIAAGATGFLGKDAPPGELIGAVRAVAAGGAVITPAVLNRILVRLAEALPAPATTTTSKLDALTDREREVLIHVARGHSNGEIAQALLVSETTIKTHVGHVLTKLRLRDRTQAVVLAYETGLIKPGA